MSSHHIVRDEQEPALLIIDPEVATWERVGPLMEWVPTLWVSEKALGKVASWGIKIDGVLAPERSFEKIRVAYADQAPLKLLKTESHEHPYSLGIFLLQAASYFAVNVFLSLRDENNLRVIEETPSKLQQVFFGENGRHLYCQQAYEKWMPQGAIFQIWQGPMSGISAEEISKTGDLRLINTVENHLQTWETTNEGMIRLVANKPFWIVEPI